MKRSTFSSRQQLPPPPSCRAPRRARSGGGRGSGSPRRTRAGSQHRTKGKGVEGRQERGKDDAAEELELWPVREASRRQRWPAEEEETGVVDWRCSEIVGGCLGFS